MAFTGAALTGFAFSLVFPSLGVEAVNCVSAENRGSALGVYTAFADLSLGLTGPLVGLIVAGLGYAPIFLFAAAFAGCALVIAGIVYQRSFAARSCEFAPAE